MKYSVLNFCSLFFPLALSFVLVCICLGFIFCSLLLHLERKVAPQARSNAVEDDTFWYKDFLCRHRRVSASDLCSPSTVQAIPFIFQQTNHFWQLCRDFPLLPSLLKQWYWVAVMREELANVLSAYQANEKLLENKWPIIAQASWGEGGGRGGQCEEIIKEMWGRRGWEALAQTVSLWKSVFAK